MSGPGFATPLTAALLAFTGNLVFDPLLQSCTLGTQVLSIIALVFALAPAGRTLSLDALQLRRTRPLARAVGVVHSLWGPWTPQRDAFARWLALLCYASLNLASGLRPLQCQTWRLGLTTAWTFLSPSAAPDFFPVTQRCYRSWPAAYLFCCKLSAYATLAYQLLFLPALLLGRPTRRLVLALELAFLTGSVFILNISFLGWYQWLLVLLFWEPPLYPDRLAARLLGRWLGPPAPPSALPWRARVGLPACFVVLWLAFAVRLPFVAESGWLGPAARLSRRALGATPWGSA